MLFATDARSYLGYLHPAPAALPLLCPIQQRTMQGLWQDGLPSRQQWPGVHLKRWRKSGREHEGESCVMQAAELWAIGAQGD